MNDSMGPFSEVAALPRPLPIRIDTFGYAAIALVVKDGWLHALVIDERGEFLVTELGRARAVPQPGDDLRMAVGWATEASEWKALAAVRRDGGQ